MTMITRTRQIKGNRYTLMYSITKDLNTSEPQMPITEYGITCSALHPNGTVSSTAEVHCISPDFHKVCTLFDILLNHKVFPNHLRDIISDLLDELLGEDDFEDFPKSA